MRSTSNISQQLDLGSNTLTINQAADDSFGGTIIGTTGTLQKSGSAALTLTGANTYNGATQVLAGSLVAANATALGTVTGGTTVNSGASLQISGAITIAEDITLNPAGGSLVLENISGNNTLSGAIAHTSNGSVTLSAATGTQLTLSGVFSSSGTATGDSWDLHIGTGSNTGTVVLSGTNTFKDAIFLDNGTLLLTNNAALGDTAKGINEMNSGVLALQGGVTISSEDITDFFGGTIQNVSGDNSFTGAIKKPFSAVTVDVANSTTLTLSGNIGSSNAITDGAEGGLSKTGAGKLTLSGTNIYKGGTTVSAGTLSVTSDANLGATWTQNGGASITSNIGGAITLDGGTLEITGTGTTFADGSINSNPLLNRFNVIDNPVVIGSSGGTIANGSGQVALTGSLTGSGTLTKTGNSVLNFWNVDGFTGDINATSGKIEVYGTSGFGSGIVTLGSSVKVIVSGNTRTISNAFVLAGDATLLTDRADYLMVNGAVITFSGNISESGGARSLTLLNDDSTNNNAIVLSGTNSYTGSTIVSANTHVFITADHNLGAGAVLLASGAELTITSATTIDNAVTLNGAAIIQTDAAVTLSGLLSGSGGLTKSGNSTLVVSNTASYSGATAVSSGTLLVDGALSATSGITVDSGATLGGSGSIFAVSSTNTATISNGGILAAGNSPGTLTINGNLSLASGAVIKAEVNGIIPGTGYDQLVVNGTVNLSGATLAIDFGGFTPTAGDNFTLIDNDNSDAITGNFATVTVGGSPVTVTGNSFIMGGRTYLINYAGGNGNDLALSALNTAPLLDASFTPSLPTIIEDVANGANTGTSIADFVVDGSMTDLDGASEAIAVTAVDNSNGVWQYSLDDGNTWSNFTNTTGQLVDLTSAARLLDGTLSAASTHKIRFVPDTNYNGTSTITFRAWDKSSGTAGGTADTTTNGGNSAFSADTDTAAITITADNDTPTLAILGSVQTNQFGHATGLEGASAIFDPVIATGSNGDHYVVAWTDMSTTSKVAVKAQVFDSNGVAITSVINVTPADLDFSTTRPITLDVDMDANGRFAVLYDTVPDAGGLTDLMFQRYNADGTAYSSAVTVSFTSNRVDGTGSIDLSDSGRILVAYNQATSDGVTNRFNFTLYASFEVTGTYTATSITSAGAITPDTAYNVDGNSLISGARLNDASSSTSMRIVRTTGSVSAAVVVDFAVGVAPSLVGVENSADWRMIYLDEASGVTQLVARTVSIGASLSATPVVGSKMVLATGVSALFRPTAVVDANGTMTIAYAVPGIGGKTSLMLGTFDATGALIDGPTLINDDVQAHFWLSGGGGDGQGSGVAYTNQTSMLAGANTPVTFALNLAVGGNGEVALNDTAAADVFTNKSGHLLGSDVEGTTLTYALNGAIAVTAVVDSLNYDLAKTGSFGILYLNSSSGAFVFVPNNAAINAVSADTSETFTVSVSDGGLSASKPLVITITGVNDTPILTAPTALTLTDTRADDTFVNQAGTLLASDDEGSTLTYGISSGITGGSDVINGLTYDVKLVGSYGTLYVNSVNGNYVYVADATAINALTSNTYDAFTVTVSDGSLTANQPLTINITGVNDTPSDISLSSDTAYVFDPANTVIGTLSATDVDNNAHTFTIISVNGQVSGSEFNAFSIVGTSLQATAVGLAAGVYSIRINADDSGTNGSYQKDVSVTVLDTLTVTVNDDDGIDAADTDSTADTRVADAIADGSGLSLREALAFAANRPTGTTINFASALTGQTITFGSNVNVAAGLTFNADGLTTLSLAGGAGVTATLAGVETFTNGVGDTLTIGVQLTGAGGLVKTGAGTLILNNTETYTGGTTLSAGILATNDLPNTGVLTLDGATLSARTNTGLTESVAVSVTANGGNLDSQNAIQFGATIAEQKRGIL